MNSTRSFPRQSQTPSGTAGFRLVDQPEPNAPTDAHHGDRGDGAAADDERAEQGSHDLPLPIEGSRNQVGRRSLVRGHHLYSDGQGACLPRGDHGLAQPGSALLGAEQHDGQQLLRESAQ